jgi:hypothetical protein
MTGGFGGSALHFADSLFHLFARLERDDELLWYKDFIASARVASFPSGPAFDLENSEVSELDPVVFDQCFDDCVERLLDDFLGLELRQTDLVGDGFDNLFLGHVGIPSESGPLRQNDTQTRALLMSQV